MTYVERFEKLGFGMFVHFGLYSVRGKGEWNQNYLQKEEYPAYHALKDKFRISKNWAKELVKTAKAAGYPVVGVYDALGFGQAQLRELSDEFIEEDESFVKLISKIDEK